MTATAPAPSRAPGGAPEPPRLLSATTASGLAGHRQRYPAPPPPSAGGRADLVGAVERAGLRGRGGAGFPTGAKLRAVLAAARSGPAAVVANGCEGEPASHKDELLLTGAPHLVLDGALLAASAVGADAVVVCVDERASATLAAVRQAIDERAAGEPGLRARLVAVPGHYVAGQSSALVQWLNGGPAVPTSGGRTAERGLGGRPTLVDNVETLAHLAQLARFGPDWFRELGTRHEPGSRLLTVSGAVGRPGVYEVEAGAPLAGVLAGAAAGPAPAGVLVGGWYGAWLTPPEAAEARLSDADLAGYGAGVGSGVVAVLGDGACPLAQTARILAWLAGQSAGQCGPCAFGLPAIAGAMAELAAGRRGVEAVERLRRWAAQVDGRGACSLPDGVAGLVRSTLRAFPEELDRHGRGACRAQSGAAPWR